MMKLLEWYDKLEKLVLRLPGPLQQPILREIRPVKDLFLHQRAPRILVCAEPAETGTALLNALIGEETASEPGTRGYQSVSRANAGTVEVLHTTDFQPIDRALTQRPPDIALFVASASAVETDSMQLIEELLASAALRRLPVLCVCVGEPVGSISTGAKLDDLLQRNSAEPGLLRATLLVDLENRDDLDRLAEAITRALPEEAKLEMARLCRVRSVQAHIAQIITKSVTAICTVIGTQPIPLADFPILTGLQVAMVTGVIYISGREMNAKFAREFLGALGANIGAGLVMREGARAALKLFPVWGHAISGAVAGAGTYAIGRAAIAYFIEGISIEDARKIFRSKQSRKQLPEK